MREHTTCPEYPESCPACLAWILEETPVTHRQCSKCSMGVGSCTCAASFPKLTAAELDDMLTGRDVLKKQLQQAREANEEMRRAYRELSEMAEAAKRIEAAARAVPWETIFLGIGWGADQAPCTTPAEWEEAKTRASELVAALGLTLDS